MTFAADGVLMFNARDTQAAGGVTVSFSAMTDSGFALDTRGNLRDVAYIKVEDEYSIAVMPAFDAIIDVEDERTTFDGAIGTAENPTSDESSVVVSKDSATITDAAFATMLADVDIVWSGNFGWIIDDEAEMDDVQPISGVVSVAIGAVPCETVVVTAVTIAATCAGSITTIGPITLKLDVDVNRDEDDMRAILPSTSFTVAVTVNYTGQDMTEGSRLFSEGAGSWTLNGFQAFLPYMPYGPSISQVIYLVNRGSQSGALIVDWVDQNGNSDSLGTVATLGPNTTLSVGPLSMLLCQWIRGQVVASGSRSRRTCRRLMYRSTPSTTIAATVHSYCTRTTGLDSS